MTRQRKEIFKKMDEAYMQCEAEIEMGCGFGVDEIYKVYNSVINELREELAVSYGMTPEEYNEYVNQFLDYDYDMPTYEECTPCATNRDYSPSNPWDAPGMSIRDFI